MSNNLSSRGRLNWRVPPTEDESSRSVSLVARGDAAIAVPWLADRSLAFVYTIYAWGTQGVHWHDSHPVKYPILWLPRSLCLVDGYCIPPHDHLLSPNSAQNSPFPFFSPHHFQSTHRPLRLRWATALNFFSSIHITFFTSPHPTFHSSNTFTNMDKIKEVNILDFPFP